MWDFILPLILMLVFYLVPEILKRKRRKEEYKYPEIPDSVPPPVPDRVPPPAGAKPRQPDRVPPPDIILPPAAEERPRPAAIVHRPPEPRPMPEDPAYTAKASSAALVSTFADTGPWAGGLEQDAVLQGIVFAEILQPPRAKRPFRHGFGRG